MMDIIDIKKVIAWSVVVSVVLISVFLAFLMLGVSVDLTVFLFTLALLVMVVSSYFIAKVLVWAFGVVINRI